MEHAVDLDDLYGFWGKAQGGWHLLPYHSLDVAACAVTLLRENARIGESLGHLTGLEREPLERLLGWTSALHDLGKFSPAFQWKVPEIASALGATACTVRNDIRHDSLGWGLWHEHFERQQVAAEWRPVARLLVGCATGHHGRPPSRMPNGRPLRARLLFDARGTAAAEAWTEWSTYFFEPKFESVDRASLARATWWIAGLVTLADWLGSSIDWFPYRGDRIDLAEYHEIALTQARLAVRESGLAHARTVRTFSDLFPDFTPSPLQQAVIDVPKTGQRLLIIEEATGGGKTEAALAAVGGDAFFFGLPTMATANAGWHRMEAVGGQQALLHAKNWLLPDAMHRAAGWLTDSNRKAMLSSIGIGTIDQAMLAVLLTRFSTLRLAGLAGRSLIIDEVHAYAPYMTEILLRLVELHARAGGSVALLSATMPIAVRTRYVEAWSRGAGMNSAACESKDFPLLTCVDAAGLREQSVTSYRSQHIDVERSHSIDDVTDRLRAAAATGRCAVWIRNTVREAVDAFDRLQAAGCSVDIFHARFAAGHRQEIEDRVLGCFGKASGPAQRAGRILVATQVVEQSLDLDFDLMVCDLAPIDLVIQRAGRLHRHARGDRGVPKLVLHAPFWSDDPPGDWLSAWSSGTTAVYPDHGQLWRTMRVLGSGFDLPSDARRLIEAVYGSSAIPVPPGIAEVAARVEAKRQEMMRKAMKNVISLTAPYGDDGTPLWEDNENAPTRLGQVSREWVLCEGDEPVCGDAARSVISLPAFRVASAPEARVLVGSWQKTMKLSAGTATVLDAGGKALFVRYDAVRGLMWKSL